MKPVASFKTKKLVLIGHYRITF